MQELLDVWTFATAWYNLPFSLALLAFLGLSALQFIGLDQDHDVDADADADIHIDVDHDLDLDHDLDHDVAHDLGGAPAWTGALAFLGVGHAPVTMILLVLMGGFGLLGWSMNALVLDLLPAYPSWALALVLVVDLLLAFWFTSRVARFIGRALPAFASTATSTARLVARRGRIISPQVDNTYGQVKVRDPGGTLITVFAVVDPGKPPLPRDTEVFLVDYDAVKKVFTVVPAD